MPDPNDELFQRHLKEPAFQKGVINGRWRTVEYNYPIFKVELATPNADRPWIAVRIDITGYATGTAPLGQFWDLTRDERLAANLWPRHPHSQAFSTAHAGLYIACDRAGLQAHPGWAQNSPNTTWRLEIGITRYLSVVYGLLQASVIPRPSQ